MRGSGHPRRSRQHDAIVAAQLVRLLGSRRSEQACAAALVLGALRPADPAVSRALARKLRSAEGPVRPYVREALARQDTDEAHAVLAEGLLGAGVEREQSRALSARCGARMLPHFDRLLAAYPDQSGAEFFAVAAAFRTRASVEWLLGHLEGAPARRALAIYRALAGVLRGAYPRSLRRLLRVRSARLAGSAPPSAAAVAVRLLRILGEPVPGCTKHAG
jgi:hypothetical protein